jgi:hypothetical protein
MRRALARLAGAYQRTEGGAVNQTLVAPVVLAARGVVAPAAIASGGNSDAAHGCQHNGYLTLHRGDGSSFTNTGDRVSYFAHRGTVPGCVVTATSGCLTLDNAVMPAGDTVDFPGPTVTVVCRAGAIRSGRALATNDLEQAAGWSKTATSETSTVAVTHATDSVNT